MAVKTETIAIKVTPEEKEQIQALAAKEEKTVSKYLHKIIFGEVNKEEVKWVETKVSAEKHFSAR